MKLHSLRTALFLVVVMTSVVAAAERFPARIKVEKKDLVLNGFGLCEYGLFEINLYWCALYLESKSSSASAIIDSKQVKRIELHFVRALTAKQLRKAYSAAFEANTGDELPEYLPGLTKLKKILVSVKKGDSLAFTYLPGEGHTAVSLNSKQLGVIEGERWGRMFVRLYLGPKPPDKDMRKGMLGGR